MQKKGKGLIKEEERELVSCKFSSKIGGNTRKKILTPQGSTSVCHDLSLVVPFTVNGNWVEFR